MATVDHPSSIIATIPGTLGYYPQESVVVIGLIDDSDGYALIGPVLRADLNRADELADFLSTMSTEDCFAFLGVVVTRIPNSATARRAIRSLENARRGDGAHLLDVCWHVSEIAQGTPYTMAFGPDPAELAAGHPNLGWAHGTVGSVINSPAMQAMRDNGTLPALSRDETFAFFGHDDECGGASVDRERITAVTARSYRRADTLRNRIDRGEPGAWAAVDRARDALEHAAAKPIIGDERPGLSAVFPSEDDVEALVTVLTRSLLRDCVIGYAVRHPETAATALLAIARSFDGVVRANALSVWALVAIRRGLSSWATTALATAQEEVPGHSMSAICLEVMAAGEQQQLVTTVLEGCELACTHLRRTEGRGGAGDTDAGTGSGEPMSA